MAQRNGSGQYDIYSMAASSGGEKQLTSNVQQDDGPDYSPDGKWIYINSDRNGNEAIWRFPPMAQVPTMPRPRSLSMTDLRLVPSCLP